MESLTRTCPKCNEIITYSSFAALKKAAKENRVCHDCRYVLYPLRNNGLNEVSREKIRLSKIGKPSWNKGIPMREESKKKLSATMKKLKTKSRHWNLGRKASPQLIEKLSKSHLGKKSPMFGKKHSEETKEKIRIALTRNLKTRGFSSKHNPTACKFIDRLNASMGWNLIHAGNGGEVQVAGYFLDGYDAQRGIIFEYDEPRHHLSKKKEKDLIRQNRILAHFGKINKRIDFYRYDEKCDRLYKVSP